ncbi:hypothetical protein IWW38_005861 [Coemansia aciculifera]|uniref:Uncharacterized protein n=1 Tax=Coemansia aciculifera TaxID=417176 RepID=A0ACC1LU12_9FUNG|nr:hypothetical protein IWW38_005861 [Coemansia aciculifera]
MMRHLNGESRGSNHSTALLDVVTVSPLVASKVADVYETAHEALIVGLLNIGDGEMGCETKCALLDDVLALYSRAEYVAAMLSDLYGLVSDLLSAERPRSKEIKRSVIACAEKRLYFLHSVVLQLQGESESWQCMAADVAMLRRRYESEGQSISAAISADDIPKASKPLPANIITEL